MILDTVVLMGFLKTTNKIAEVLPVNIFRLVVTTHYLNQANLHNI